jgi:hypothetical protein
MFADASATELSASPGISIGDDELYMLTVQYYRNSYFSNFSDLHLRIGIAMISPPRPAFCRGERAALEKEKRESLCEEES